VRARLQAAREDYVGQLPRYLVAAALVVAGGTALAAGLGFLADSPVSRFNEEDLRLMNGAVDRALASAELGMPLRWANSVTSSSGEVTPQRAFDRGGRPCRELKVVNRHRALEDSGIYVLCRDGESWTPSAP
jgi:surface antigen